MAGMDVFTLICSGGGESRMEAKYFERQFLLITIQTIGGYYFSLDVHTNGYM